MKREQADPRDHDEFARLLGRVREDLDIDWDTSALKLYRDARDVAEERLPGPLGVAVAAVLAGAAYERSLQSMAGSLGATNSTMAMAVAVLSIVPSDEAAT